MLIRYCGVSLHLYEVTSYDMSAFAYVVARDSEEAMELARTAIPAMNGRRNLLCAFMTESDSTLVSVVSVDDVDLWTRMQQQDTPSVLHVIRKATATVSTAS